MRSLGSTVFLSLLLHAGVAASLVLSGVSPLSWKKPSAPEALWIQTTAAVTRTPIKARHSARTHTAPGPNTPETEPAKQTDAAPDPASIFLYTNYVRAKINSALSYPRTLRRRAVQGRVPLLITIRPSGDLERAEIDGNGSGSPELDGLALDAVKKAAPFRPFGEDLRGHERVRLSLPIDFRLTRG